MKTDEQQSTRGQKYISEDKVKKGEAEDEREAITLKHLQPSHGPLQSKLWQKYTIYHILSSHFHCFSRHLEQILRASSISALYSYKALNAGLVLVIYTI